MADTNAQSANLGFEAKLFLAADKLRGSMDASEYKHVALGLVFLKYISDVFNTVFVKLQADEYADEEDAEEYLAERTFWVPKESRWAHLQANAKQPTIGKLVDDAMLAIEKSNASLKGVLPTNYAREALNKTMLGELIDLISTIGMNEESDKSKDILGRVYEYFLGGFAGAEGKRGGEFYTPSSVVRVLTEMLEPYKGRVYDPCCGSGGMFVQSERFVVEHGGSIGDIRVYGQEMNNTTWRLAKMNMAMRGIDADIKWNNEGSFYKDELTDLKADCILANPPFNISDWGGDKLSEDVRWKYGVPPAGNANYAWLQHIVHHLAPNGAAGVVLSTGSLTTKSSQEFEVRKAMLENGLIECIVELPNQLFYSTPIPACIWILRRESEKIKNYANKNVLFIYARSLGVMTSQSHKELEAEDIKKISSTYLAWKNNNVNYVDKLAFCKSVTIKEVIDYKYTLAPGRYVGFIDEHDTGESTDDKIKRLMNEYENRRNLINQYESTFLSAIRKIGK